MAFNTTQIETRHTKNMQYNSTCNKKQKHSKKKQIQTLQLQRRRQFHYN